jgi:ferric-dicitrate binding protein FerR (iron transport regulator)
MNNKDPIVENLFTGYFANSLTSEELERLKSRINQSPEIRKEFQMLKKIWFSCISDTPDNEQALQKFFLLTGRANPPARRKRTRQIWLQSAAVAAVLMMVTFILFQQGNRQADEQFAEIIIEAPAGMLQEILLPDGTSVWLNAASRITYLQGFGVSERRVFLTGEGYFDVKHIEELPFIVQTNELQVCVIGTKFNVKNYFDDDKTTICLLEGKVLVDNHVRKNEDIIMTPGQKVFFDKKTGETRLTQVTAGSEAEWINGVLFFDEDVLTDIAKVLERSYDVKITIHPDLMNMRLYGSFSRKEQTITDILDILTSAGEIKFAINGNEIIIKP